MDDNKSKALAAALSQIEKQFGKGSVMRMGESDIAKDIQAVSTGSLGLDIGLGIGGLPRGRVVEIYGPESSGKTTLTRGLPQRRSFRRACLKTQRGPAAREFGGGQGGEAGASPKRAATAESTRATGKRPAARRVFSETARCLRCSSVTDPSGYAPSSRLAIEPFLRKQGPSEFSDRL